METEGIQKLSQAGNYWLGNNLSLVDVTFYPWFEWLGILEHYRGVKLPENCQKLQQWWQEMLQRESVQSIKNSEEFYLKDYEKYANNTASGVTAQEMRES